MSEYSFDQLIASMTHEAWQAMRRAVETGRWPDGRQLTAEQQQLSLQAVIAWEERNGLPAEQRTGYVSPAGCHSDEQDEQPVALRPAGEKDA